MNKTCYKCKEDKPATLEFFYKAKPGHCRFGLTSPCKTCVAKRNADPAVIAMKNAGNRKRWATNAAFREERRIYRQKLRDANKEAQREYNRQWLEANRASVYARINRRKAIKKQACPPWARSGEIHEAIKLVYEEAVRLTKETGVMYSVDHIVPLQSDIVQGLHVPANLQVLTQFDNLSKSNKFEPIFTSTN